jgi:hypothetical protein
VAAFISTGTESCVISKITELDDALGSHLGNKGTAVLRPYEE